MLIPGTQVFTANHYFTPAKISFVKPIIGTKHNSDKSNQMLGIQLSHTIVSLSNLQLLKIIFLF